MEKLSIYLIHATDCKDCEEMKSSLFEILKDKSIQNYEMIEINSESEAAIDFAIENDIDDIPACVIGNYSFCGKKGWSYEKLEFAIEKTLEENNDIE